MINKGQFEGSKTNKFVESILNNPVAFQSAKVPDKSSIKPSSYILFKSVKSKTKTPQSQKNQLSKEESAKAKEVEMPSDLASAILKYAGKKYGKTNTSSSIGGGGGVGNGIDKRNKRKEKKISEDDKKEKLKKLLLQSNNISSSDGKEEEELSQDEFKNDDEFVDARESFDDSDKEDVRKVDVEKEEEDESEEEDGDFQLNEQDSDSTSESEMETDLESGAGSGAGSGSELESNTELAGNDDPRASEVSEEEEGDQKFDNINSLKKDLKEDTLSKEILGSNTTSEEEDIIEGQLIETQYSLNDFYDLNENKYDRGSNGSTRIMKSWNGFAQGHTALGLLNHGVTCYMNSAIQALCHIPSLTHYLADIANNKYEGQIKQDSVSMVLASTISKMYRVGHERKLMHINPKKLCNRLEDINCMMSEWQQEDSHEYLMSLMSRLQEDSTPRGVKLNQSIIYDIFGGLLDQSVTCKNCGYISITQQEFYDLSLTLDNRKKRSSLMIEPQQLYQLREQIENCKLSNEESKIQLSDLLKQKILVAQEERRSRSQTPEPNNINNNINNINNDKDKDNNENEGDDKPRTYSIENSIKDFFTPEIIKTDKRDQSGYLCEKCSKKTNAIKISTIARSPETLSIHLKRFRFNGQQSQKVKANVTYPEFLDLTEYTTSMMSPTKYKLTSVIVHQGRSVSSGHYIAHCRQQDGSWATYDDEYVNKVRSSVALSDPGAYVLIYERLTHKSSDNNNNNNNNNNNKKKRSLNDDGFGKNNNQNKNNNKNKRRRK